jgi:hypothetical protein
MSAKPMTRKAWLAYLHKAVDEFDWSTVEQEPVAKNICIECANADSWGLPDKAICRSCFANSKWQPLNASSKNPYPPQRTWVGLTDEDRQAAFESMPDMLDGFLKTWGWLHFSKAIEAKLKEKNT